MTTAPHDISSQRAGAAGVWTVTSLLALTLVFFVLQQQALLAAGALLCALYACATTIRSPFSLQQLLAFTIGCALLLPAFIKSYFGLTPQFYFFSTLAVFFAASALTRHPPRVFMQAFRIIYAVSLLGIAWALYVYWDVPEPLGEVIEGSSTNGIPAYLIVVQIGLSLSTYLVTRRLPVISPMLTVAVAFFGYGRGSLVVGALLVVLSLAFNLWQLRSAPGVRRYALPLFVVVLVVVVAWNSEDLVELLFDYTKLGVGLVDVNRLEIWEQYVDKIDVWSLLVGADFSGTVIETARAGNPHISYIRTHAYFGLPATLLALLSPLAVFLSGKSWKSKLVFASFLGAAALRAASEPILFPTLLDLFYFSYLFLFFRYAPAGRSVRPHRDRSLAMAQ